MKKETKAEQELRELKRAVRAVLPDLESRNEHRQYTDERRRDYERLRELVDEEK